MEGEQTGSASCRLCGDHQRAAHPALARAHLCIVALKGRLIALLHRQVNRQLQSLPC